MDEISTSIKDYALTIDTTLDEDDELLDFVVESVIDRALIYTNRYQLVEDYEEDNTNTSPIPTQLERVLAEVVIRTYRTIAERNEADNYAVKSIKDNGQEVTYSDQLKSYLNGSRDTDIFVGAEETLKRFRLPDIIEHTKQF